jgi:hypothetical protein
MRQGAIGDEVTPTGRPPPGGGRERVNYTNDIAGDDMP